MIFLIDNDFSIRPLSGCWETWLSIEIFLGGSFGYFYLFSGWRKRGAEFKGGSRHDRNRYNRHNRQNRQNRHGCLLVLYFVGQAKGAKVLSRTTKTIETTKTAMKATPLKLNPLFRHPDFLLRKFQRLADGYFANEYFENPWKVPRKPPLRKRKGGKRLDPSEKNRRLANPLKNMRLSSHWNSKVPVSKLPVCVPPIYIFF